MAIEEHPDQSNICRDLKTAAAELGIGYMACWRRLRRGDFEGVRRTERGAWLIPLPSIAKVKASMKRRASAKEA